MPAARFVEAALRALDEMRCQAHQLVGLNFVAAERAGKREVELGFPLNGSVIISPAAHLHLIPLIGE